MQRMDDVDYDYDYEIELLLTCLFIVSSLSSTDLQHRQRGHSLL